jgi:hypothetical protein
MMGGQVSTWDTIGAVSLAAWAAAMWVALGALVLANRRRVRPWVCRSAAALVIVGLVGQIGHVQEHVAQVGYWVQHPNSPGWMTPWGTGLSHGFGQVDRAKPALGMEILHLTGNFVFLAGLGAAMIVTSRARATKARRWAGIGTWMQTIHGLEHLSLTLSIAFGAKRAIGLSTWFGLMSGGPGLWTYRIWWHFVANVLGSAIFATAAVHLWRERAVIEASYRHAIAANPTTPSGGAVITGGPIAAGLPA